MSKLTRFVVLPVFGLIAVLLAMHVLFDQQFSSLRGKSFDFYQNLKPRVASSNDVAIVTIDEASLQRFGQWPWPRSTMAKLVTGLSRANAASVGLDILFAEEERSADGQTSDALLANAIQAAPTVLAMSLDEAMMTNEIRPKSGWSIAGSGSIANLPGFRGVIASLPNLSDAAQGLGVIRAIPDNDGVVRRVPLVWIHNKANPAPEADASANGNYELWPSFALENLRVAIGTNGFVARLNDTGFDAMKFASDIIPLMSDGSIWLWERAGSFPTVSALDVIDGNAGDRLSGKITLVTVNAIGLDQYHITPSRAPRLGTEVHALLIEQLIEGKFLSEPGWAKQFERGLFVVGSLLVLLGLMLARRFPKTATVVTVALIATPLLVGYYAYSNQSMLLEPLQPAGGILLVAMTAVGLSYRLAEQGRDLIRRQFSQFLSPAVVEKLTASTDELELSGEKRNITVMMLDLRGFTTLTENLDAREIGDLVNHFLSIASEEIFHRDGTIDKFMGDAVLAFWNAPLDQSNHEALALDAAEAILKQVERNNPTLTAKGLPAIKVGAGLESGVCSVGNFGSRLRFDYTAIGNAVNHAARIESATKSVGVELLAGPNLAAQLPDRLVKAGIVDLHNVSEPVTVFTTLDRAAAR